MKTMRRALFATALIASLQSGASGNSDGGGGGTLPADPISIDQLLSVIENAKTELEMVINYRIYVYRPMYATELEKKLYGATPNLRDVFMATGLEVRTNEPCYDANKNEVDASIFAKNANDICLSASRIAKKIIAERARFELIGLIAHELSHKLGTTEDEAVEVQSDFANRFLRLSTDDSARNQVKPAIDLARDIYPDFRTVEEFARDIPDKLTKKQLQSRINNIGPKTYKLRELLHTGRVPTYTLLQKAEMDRARVAMARFSVVYYFVYNLDSQLDRIFQGKDEITYSEWAERNFGNKEANVFGDEKITRPRQIADLENIFKDLADQYNDITDLLFELARPYLREAVNETTLRFSVGNP